VRRCSRHFDLYTKAGCNAGSQLLIRTVEVTQLAIDDFGTFRISGRRQAFPGLTAEIIPPMHFPLVGHNPVAPIP